MNLSLAETIKKASEITGQIGATEIRTLYQLAKNVPPGGLAVEIGCYQGRSSFSLAAGLPEGARLVCIDPWTLQKPSARDYHKPETLLAWQRHMTRFRDISTQIVGFPLHVMKWWHQPIDLLFVDAMKREESVRLLWEGWLPFCRGWIATHDYQPDADPNRKYFKWHYPGVCKVVETILKPRTTDHAREHFIWAGKLKPEAVAWAGRVREGLPR